MLPLKVAAVCVAISLATGACASSTDESPQDRFAAEFIADALPNASQFQADIIGDGHVDFSEYERSVLAVVSCLENEGLEVQEPVLQPDGYTYWYLYRGTTASGELLPDAEVNAKFESCYGRFGELVDSVWFAQNAEAIGDLPQELKDPILDCLASYNIELPRDSHVSEIYGVMARNPDLEEACGSLRPDS